MHIYLAGFHFVFLGTAVIDVAMLSSPIPKQLWLGLRLWLHSHPGPLFPDMSCHDGSPLICCIWSKTQFKLHLCSQRICQCGMCRMSTGIPLFEQLLVKWICANISYRWSFPRSRWSRHPPRPRRNRRRSRVYHTDAPLAYSDPSWSGTCWQVQVPRWPTVRMLDVNPCTAAQLNNYLMGVTLSIKFAASGELKLICNFH